MREGGGGVEVEEMEGWKREERRAVRREGD